jgi:hypothetical protein
VNIDGKLVVMKKSSLYWLLDDTKGRVSTDRLRRFIIVYCYISEERDALLNENENWITSDSELI